MVTGRSRLSGYVVTLSAVLGLVFLALAVSYGIARSQLRDAAFQIDERAFANTVESIEDRIALTDTVLQNILQSRRMRDFTRGLYESEGRRRLEMSSFQRWLRSFLRGFPELAGIAVIPRNQDWVLTDQSIYRMDSFWDPAARRLVNSAPVRGTFVGPRRIQRNPLYEDSSEEMLTIARGYPLGTGGSVRLGGGLIYVDVSGIRGTLDTIRENAGVDIRVTDASGRLIHDFAEDTRKFGPENSTTGNHTGWTYQARSIQNPIAETTDFRYLFAVSGFIVLLIAAVVVTLIDRTTRRPLERVVRHIADRVHQVQESEGKRDVAISEVEDEVRSILERSKRLQSQVDLSLPALRWQLLMEQLLSQHAASERDMGSAIGLDLPGPSYTVFLVRNDHAELDESGKALSAVVEETLFDALLKLGSVETLRMVDGTVAAILSTTVDPCTKNCTELLGGVLDLDENAVVAVGKTVNGPGAIHQSYVTARETLEYQLVAPNQRIYSFGKLPVDTGGELPNTVESRLRELPPLLHGENEQRLYGWLEQYLDEIQRRAVSPATMKHAVVRLIIVARDEVARVSLAAQFPGEDMIHDAWNSLSFASVRALGVEALRRARESIREFKSLDKGPARLGKDLVAWVDRHYDRTDLSLSLVAEIFKLSESYVSKVFRQELGQTFQEYVMYRRAKLAEELLIETSYTVSDVASEVGYAEVHSLIRVFKRVYGMTPREFRRRAVQAQVAGREDEDTAARTSDARHEESENAVAHRGAHETDAHETDAHETDAHEEEGVR